DICLSSYPCRGCQPNLTNSSAADASPSWSPRGDKIAFERDQNGNWDIYAMNSDGTGQTQLTNDPAQDEVPSWSPRGDKIAFASTASENGGSMWRTAMGGGRPTCPTTPSRTVACRPGPLKDSASPSRATPNSRAA